MGAPNIESWLPGKKSIINTADFSSPKALAEYINHLNENDDEYEEYFVWKQEGLSENFIDKYNVSTLTSTLCNLLITNINAYFMAQNAGCVYR
jgi:Glycosyltransferase family 10 (fucosyltransferase) C-term